MLDDPVRVKPVTFRNGLSFVPDLPVCDVLIVGGGPAGLAAAIATRQRGLDVLVADALIPPIDKACGEGLMPDSLRDLRQLGVELTGGRRFSGILFSHQRADREDVAMGPFQNGEGLGIHRADLHRQLIDHAAAIGVRMKWGCRVDLGEARSSRHRATVGGEDCAYRYLVGADGEASRVRRWAGLESGSLRSQRLGFRRHYRIAPWSDTVEVHWCDPGQVYVTPVAQDEVCFVAVTSRRGLNFDGILEGLPHLRSKLRGGVGVGRNRGAVTSTRKLNRVTSGDVALVGDASGSVDAITGAGLGLAFREALLLAESLERDTIAEYERGHGAILRLSQTMAAILTWMDRSPTIRDRVLRTFSGNPDLFERLLAVHSGEESLTHFATTRGIQLAFRLLVSNRNSLASEVSSPVDAYRHIA